MKALSVLPPGSKAVIDHLETPDEVSLKLMELGVCPGETVQFLRQAPFGGPIEIELMGYRLCIRASDAAKIFCQEVPTP